MKRTRDSRDGHSSMNARETRGREYVVDLACFVREPTIRHCLASIQNDCLTNDITFTEDGRATTAKFHRHLQLRYKVFARECVEYMYVCQFIPWYIERVNGEAIPRTLPLGSFTWQAHFKKDWEQHQGGWPIKYVLNGIDFDLDKLNVQIFYVVQPLYREMASPMDTLNEYHKQASLARSDVASSVKSSLTSLVLVSETVDNKIQTESGLDILDASRRYNVGGKTANDYQQRQLLTATTTGAVLDNVNEAQMCWLSAVQQQHENLGISLVPPNSQITQVTAPALTSDVMTRFQEHYRMSVHAHFNVRLSHGTSTNGGASQAADTPGTLTEQHNSVLNVSRFLEDFLPQVYKAALKVTGVVTCSLELVNKLEINSVADVKVLCECGILGPLEVRDMLAATLTRSKPDPCRLVSFAAKAK